MFSLKSLRQNQLRLVEPSKDEIITLAAATAFLAGPDADFQILRQLVELLDVGSITFSHGNHWDHLACIESSNILLLCWVVVLDADLVVIRPERDEFAIGKPLMLEGHLDLDAIQSLLNLLQQIRHPLQNLHVVRKLTGQH